jgi:predicted MFS family arabinose efflux permease
MTRTGWTVALAAAALTAIASGGRQVFGVFVSPLNTASGMGLAMISFALALGQLGVGVAQPWLGHLADRAGAARVVVMGALVLAVSMALPVFPLAPGALFLALVVSSVAASAVASNGLLLGPVSRAAEARNAGLAVGIVGAGASVGQLVLGPLMQGLIDAQGWKVALLTLATLSLLAVPVALMLREPWGGSVPRPRHAVGEALREWDFWRYALSFGACGMHVAFLGAHMPGAIERCGFPASLAGPWIAAAGAANIAGSLAVGFAMKRWKAAPLLTSIYLLRAAAIALFVAVPTSVATLIAFALAMGATHMATLPPTTALVAERYGTARIGTLFGIVMLVHQAGAFAGIWLGGWLAARTGQDHFFWGMDIALALGAGWLVALRPRRYIDFHPGSHARATTPSRSSGAAGFTR